MDTMKNVTNVNSLEPATQSATTTVVPISSIIIKAIGHWSDEFASITGLEKMQMVTRIKNLASYIEKSVKEQDSKFGVNTLSDYRLVSNIFYAIFGIKGFKTTFGAAYESGRLSLEKLLGNMENVRIWRNIYGLLIRDVFDLITFSYEDENGIRKTRMIGSKNENGELIPIVDGEAYKTMVYGDYVPIPLWDVEINGKANARTLNAFRAHIWKLKDR